MGVKNSGNGITVSHHIAGRRRVRKDGGKAQAALRRHYADLYNQHTKAPGTVAREDLEQVVEFFITNPAAPQDLAKALLLQRQLRARP